MNFEEHLNRFCELNQEYTVYKGYAGQYAFGLCIGIIIPKGDTGADIPGKLQQYLKTVNYEGSEQEHPVFIELSSKNIVIYPDVDSNLIKKSCYTFEYGDSECLDDDAYIYIINFNHEVPYRYAYDVVRAAHSNENRYDNLLNADFQEKYDIKNVTRLMNDI
jgi:hypothetical protein